MSNLGIHIKRPNNDDVVLTQESIDQALEHLQKYQNLFTDNMIQRFVRDLDEQQQILDRQKRSLRV